MLYNYYLQEFMNSMVLGYHEPTSMKMMWNWADLCGIVYTLSSEEFIWNANGSAIDS